MREIKFRVFDGKEMQEVGVIDFEGKESMDYYNWYDHYAGQTYSFDKYPLMQFTGLLDKNGKEIYEGDVITCHTNNTYKYPHKGQVIYLEHAAGFGITTEPIVSRVTGEEKEAFTYFWANEEFEIIGNIYENAELLKESQ